MVEFWRYSSQTRCGHAQHPTTNARRNRVLDLWAAGVTIDTIAYITHMSTDAISKHLRAARKIGDARAVVRHAATRRALEIAE